MLSNEDEGGIRFDDPSIGIDWPKLTDSYILSDKDLALGSPDRTEGERIYPPAEMGKRSGTIPKRNRELRSIYKSIIKFYW